jgi:hypothetical protein
VARRRVRPVRRAAVAAALCLLAAGWSCAPDSGLTSVSDYDVVITTYVPGADYGGLRTYAMPDSVAHVIDADNPPEDVTRDFDDVILATVEEQLQLLGYLEEPDPENTRPDIFVPVTVTVSMHAGIYYEWYPVWDWYPWWPGWGSGWETWYPVGNTYTYASGTIFIDMWDVKNADEDSMTVPVIWNAAINGLLSDTPGGIEDRIVASIRKAFEQSPYLGAEE